MVGTTIESGGHTLVPQQEHSSVSGNRGRVASFRGLVLSIQLEMWG